MERDAMRDAALQSAVLYCSKCGQSFVTTIVINVEIAVWIKFMQSLHCKHCGAGYKALELGKTPLRSVPKGKQ